MKIKIEFTSSNELTLTGIDCITRANIDGTITIDPLPLPFNAYDKIFYCNDAEGNKIGEPYSYNDFMQQIKDMSGVSPELMGNE